MTEERRIAPLSGVEVRKADDGSLTFSGIAAVFDSETEFGNFRETIAPGAFAQSLKEKDDVRLLVNHDGIPLARTKSGTLDLWSEDDGLHVESRLDPANPRVQELASAMKRGDLDQMSFAFQAREEDIDEEQDPPLRTLRNLKLFDVSAVTYPAYEETSAAIRTNTEDLERRVKIELLANYAASMGLKLRDSGEAKKPSEPEVPAPPPAVEHWAERQRQRRRRAALANGGK